jgi:hypothetical protein
VKVHPVARRVDELFRHEGRLFDMVTQTSAAIAPGVSNFLVGNPQEEPDPALVEALREAALPGERTGSPTRQTMPVPSRPWPKG